MTHYTDTHPTHPDLLVVKVMPSVIHQTPHLQLCFEVDWALTKMGLELHGLYL